MGGPLLFPFSGPHLSFAAARPDLALRRVSVAGSQEWLCFPQCPVKAAAFSLWLRSEAERQVSWADAGQSNQCVSHDELIRFLCSSSSPGHNCYALTMERELSRTQISPSVWFG